MAVSSLLAWGYVAYSNVAQMPDLTARLSTLHSVLTERLVVKDHLLSLAGRLDLVLSQMEIRSASSRPTLSSSNAIATKPADAKPDKQVTRYVEGESSEEDESSVPDDAQIEHGDEDEGSVEDIELGDDSDIEHPKRHALPFDGASDEMVSDEDDSEFDEELPDDDDEEEDEDDDSQDDEDSGSDDGAPHVNGFVDDEAVEWSGEEDEDSEEE
jgi:U3 small nucleolar RNA-associated protein 5